MKIWDSVYTYMLEHLFDIASSFFNLEKLGLLLQLKMKFENLIISNFFIFLSLKQMTKNQRVSQQQHQLQQQQ